MSWDDQHWIRKGVDYWLSQGVSLVLLTLTLVEAREYGEVAEMWRVFKQALDRLATGRAGYPGGLPFVRVYERQEKRHRRTGETALHLHVLIGGLQYRGDRLSGKPSRRQHRKAEELGVDGAAVTKEEVQKLAVRYGFGPVLDITQVQASPGDTGAAFEVARYLGKYLAKFENLADWLPKGKQVVAGSLGGHNWAGPGVTRQSTRRERQERVRQRRQALRTAPASGEAPGEPGRVETETGEQLELPAPWPPRRRLRR